MILKIESNPPSLTKGDLVIYLLHHRSGKVTTHVGEVISGYNEHFTSEGKGYAVKNIKTGKIERPYTQDTVLVNEGVSCSGVKAMLVDTALPMV